MAGWGSLPVELRLMVFNGIADGASEGRRLLSTCAAVNREWRAFFERVTFRKLVLTAEEDIRFMKFLVIGRRWGFVKHIVLLTQLGRYYCHNISRYLVQPTADNNNYTFNCLVRALFFVLARWTTSDSRGVHLEFAAFSGSDEKHDYQNISYSSELARRQVTVDDAAHGWMNGRRSRPFHNISQFRLFGFPLLYNLDRLPRVPVITGFTIRRQFFHTYTPSTLAYIFAMLPNLELIQLETWRHPDNQIAGTLDLGYSQFFADSIPRTTRRLFMFEDSDCTLFRNQHGRTFDPHSAAALAKSTQHVEHLSLAQFTDAVHFFNPFLTVETAERSDLSWQHLQTIALTSPLLAVDQPPESIKVLLEATARAVKVMPKLHILELWYCSHLSIDPSSFLNTGFRLRYERDDHATALSVTSTWGFNLDTGTKQVWQQVAREHSRHPLQVVEDTWTLEQPDRRLTHGRMLNLLSLGGNFVCPLSRRQLEWEATNDY